MAEKKAEKIKKERIKTVSMYICLIRSRLFLIENSLEFISFYRFQYLSILLRKSV